MRLNKKYAISAAVTAITAAALITAMSVTAMRLMSYADTQWPEGMYFRAHQEYVCSAGGEPTYFNFYGMNVGKSEDNLPDPGRSVCYVGGVRADDFHFIFNYEMPRYDAFQLNVDFTADESFTATEIVFETDGVRVTYDIGKAVYDCIDPSEIAEGGARLGTSFSFNFRVDENNYRSYNMRLRNGSDKEVTVESVRLDYPDFNNFTYEFADNRPQEDVVFPFTLRPGDTVSIYVEYDGGEKYAVRALRPAVYCSRDGVRNCMSVAGIDVFYIDPSNEEMIEFINSER